MHYPGGKRERREGIGTKKEAKTCKAPLEEVGVGQSAGWPITAGVRHPWAVSGAGIPRKVLRTRA
jgi:hypothetical protein